MSKQWTICHPCEASLEIKKSQFISHLVPSARFEESMLQLRDQHRKARHFVWALRRLNSRQQIVENCSDDGEPKNTAGKPTLKVLQGRDLVDVALITVRYFGGIKLGTGGLVRAYNDAAQAVLLEASPVTCDSLHQQTVRIPYREVRQIEYQLKRCDAKLISKEFGADFADFTLQGEASQLDKIINSIEVIERFDSD